ncbi:integrase/recombinase XerC [Nonomuraea thailandensis]|uniref:Integrase/recombinase XerC n=1 Tax=Nonomuraea thailandensis TaxID=1188745 RepID=A0A9X2H367_9ACTN|nr:tyrosine-type recombinase/integrase [Nonomuraea thailandensis]MCP2365748.1 integrase/recombinase XerC [Nonomuraea thailandensis]
MGRRQEVPAAFTAVHDDYTAALERAPLDDDTRRAYASRVRSFLAWLDAADLDGADPLSDAHGRDFAVRDYKTHLKTVAKRKANTVNAHLAALDHFFTHRGLGPVQVRRDTPPKLAPQALDAREQKRFLRAVEVRRLARDRAIGRLLFYSGLRVAELVALDVDDVPLSARKGKVIVRNGKGETSREVPLLDVTVREAVKEWKAERSEWPGAGGPALFLNRYRGGRLSARAVDQLLDELAAEADLVDESGAPAASAHTLRHTFGTNLLRQGVDIVVVAELLGHARLDTTRRYTLPTHGDLEAAVAKLPTDQ